MLPEFDADGNLPPGLHPATWEEVVQRYGTSAHRRGLLAGLRAALLSIKGAGGSTAYLDGSFISRKAVPSDFDACWDPRGVDPDKLDPVLLVFANKREAQKAKFGGEVFPSSSCAARSGITFLDFFQVDKTTGQPKGIIVLDLKRWSP